jgi:hypothetical protein
MRERLEAELAAAEAELQRHLASWEYAYAMGSSRDGSSEHPVHWLTRARTEELEARRRDAAAALGSHLRDPPEREGGKPHG